MKAVTIVGQDQPRKFLALDIEQDRISHAYLFHGPSGVGKKLTAKLFFREINSHESHCHCLFCRKVEREIHPDLYIVQPDPKFITIKQVREAQHFLSLLPLESKLKMVIFDEAHELKTEAANALLKTLEEPPDKNILILITSIPERISLTVKSRCRKISFNTIDSVAISSFLEKNFGLDKQKAVLTSKLSRGVFSKAISTSGDRTFWQNRAKTIEMAFRLLSADMEERFKFAEQLYQFAKGQTQDVDKAHRQEALRLMIADSLSIVQSVYRDIAIIKETGDSRLALNSDRLEEIKNSLPGIDSFDLVEYIEMIENAKNKLKRNANIVLLLQSSFLALGKEP